MQYNFGMVLQGYRLRLLCKYCNKVVQMVPWKWLVTSPSHDGEFYGAPSLIKLIHSFSSILRYQNHTHPEE